MHGYWLHQRELTKIWGDENPTGWSDPSVCARSLLLADLFFFHWHIPPPLFIASCFGNACVCQLVLETFQQCCQAGSSRLFQQAVLSQPCRCSHSQPAVTSLQQKLSWVLLQALGKEASPGRYRGAAVPWHEFHGLFSLVFACCAVFVMLPLVSPLHEAHPGGGSAANYI